MVRADCGADDGEGGDGYISGLPFLRLGWGSVTPPLGWFLFAWKRIGEEGERDHPHGVTRRAAKRHFKQIERRHLE